MARARINKRVLDGLKVGDQVWSTEVRGFGARHRKTGVYFLLKRMVAGTRRTIAIGRYGDKPDDISLAEARAIADRLIGKIAQGIDPTDSKRLLESSCTLKELSRSFILRCEQKRLKEQTINSYKRVLDLYLVPVLGRAKALSVTARQISNLHTKISNMPRPEKGIKKGGPYIANRMLAVVSSMYGWAVSSGTFPPGTRSPTEHVERNVELKKQRFLAPDEMVRLGKSLALLETTGWDLDEGRKVLPAPHPVAAIRLLMLTGCRLREVLQLKWSEVNADIGALILDDSKTGAKTVPLSDDALLILEDLKKLKWSKFVFPSSTDDEKPRVDLKRPWAAVTEHAELADLRIHDLRHTFASFGVSQNISLHAVGGLLGHAQSSTTHRYAHLALAPQRQVANAIAGPIARALQVNVQEAKK
jgi:integrase